MSGKNWDWTTPKGQVEIAGVIRKLAKKKPEFTLYDLAVEMGLTPIRTKRKYKGVEKVYKGIGSYRRVFLENIFRELPSAVHDPKENKSFAHEIFDIAKGKSIQHIKNIFGHELGDQLLADYIDENFRLHPKDVAKDLGVSLNALRQYTKNSGIGRWTEWREWHTSTRNRLEQERKIRDSRKAKAKGRRRDRTFKKFAKR